MHFHLGWIFVAPYVVAALGIAGFIGLAVIRWINEHDESRATRALWAVLWGCGLAMLAMGAALAKRSGFWL